MSGGEGNILHVCTHSTGSMKGSDNVITDLLENINPWSSDCF